MRSNSWVYSTEFLDGMVEPEGSDVGPKSRIELDEIDFSSVASFIFVIDLIAEPLFSAEGAGVFISLGVGGVKSLISTVISTGGLGALG